MAAHKAVRRSARLQEASDIAAGRKVDSKSSKITKSQPAPKPGSKTVKYDCATCDRTLAASSFPKYLPTDHCEHLINTCKACLKQWITVQLDSTTYDNIACPECPQLMQNSDIKLHATKDDYQRFDELERRGIADKTPGWRWCLAPYCRAGQIHQPSIENAGSNKTKGKGKKKPTKKQMMEALICTCNQCGAKACTTCDRPWHKNETCEEYQQRIKKEGFEKEEAATLKTIQKECKQCPGCQKNIVRNGGCDHMVCTQCRVQFCWLCLRRYNDIARDGHGPGCVYALPGRIDPHLPQQVIQMGQMGQMAQGAQGNRQPGIPLGQGGAAAAAGGGGGGFVQGIVGGVRAFMGAGQGANGANR